jgi:hypothetical protein
MRPRTSLLVLLAVLSCSCVKRPGPIVRDSVVVLDGDRSCRSNAAHITLDTGTQTVPATELVTILSSMSGVRIHSKRDLSNVRVRVRANDTPWDCILGDLARQVGLRPHVRGDVVTLE